MNTTDCKPRAHARYTLFEREYNGSIYKAQILYCADKGAVSLIPCVYSEKMAGDAHIDPQTLYFGTPAQAVKYISGLGRACA